MPKTQIRSERLATPSGVFSHATMIEAKGRLVFISGMTARRADGTIAGQLANRDALETWRHGDDRFPFARRAAVALHRREHHRVKQRPGARDARGVAERSPIEVSNPDADGHVARVADGPVVVVRL